MQSEATFAIDTVSRGTKRLRALAESFARLLAKDQRVQPYKLWSRAR